MKVLCSILRTSGSVIETEKMNSNPANDPPSSSKQFGVLHLGLSLPRTLWFDPPVSDAEFERFCRVNDAVQFEHMKDGGIRMSPKADLTPLQHLEQRISALEQRFEELPEKK